VSRRGRVGSRRAVTYLITPVMTWRVTWRSNTRVAIMMMTLVRNDDDDATMLIMLVIMLLLLPAVIYTLRIEKMSCQILNKFSRSDAHSHFSHCCNLSMNNAFRPLNSFRVRHSGHVCKSEFPFFCRGKFKTVFPWLRITEFVKQLNSVFLAHGVYVPC